MICKDIPLTRFNVTVMHKKWPHQEQEFPEKRHIICETYYIIVSYYTLIT
jgi:hypothetical protein